MGFSDTYNINSPKARMSQVGQALDALYTGNIYNGGTTAGSSNAYTASLTPAITAYFDGLMVLVKSDRANTGATTLNINSVGAKNVYKKNGTTALVANDMLALSAYLFRYDSALNAAAGGWILLNPQVLDSLTVTNAATIGTTLGVTGATTVAALTASGIITANNLTATSAVSLNASKELVTNTHTTWTPDATGGTMTVTAESWLDCFYLDLGNIVHFCCSMSYTIGGTPIATITIPFPITCTAHSGSSYFACQANEAGAGATNPRWQYNGTNILLTKAGAGAWAAGAGACYIMGYLRK